MATPAHENCIDGSKLKTFLIELLQQERKREGEVRDTLSPVGRAYINSEIMLLEKWAMFVAQILKENTSKGAIDMEKLKSGLVVRLVKLEDLNLRRMPSTLERELMDLIQNDLKPTGGEEKAAIISEDKIKYRSLAAYVSRLRRLKKLDGMEVKVRKDAEGNTCLVRYK